MKELTEYMMDSAKKYVYRVKIAGEFPKEIFNSFKKSLEMFDVDSCTDPKKTPIQSDPHGFPGLKNEEVNIFDVTLNYPANSEQIIQLARRHGIDPAKIVVVGKDFNDSMNKELEGVEQATRLATPDYPAQTKEQKEASEAYADSYKKAAAEFANGKGVKFEVAGKEKPFSNLQSNDEEKKDSPFSKVKRLSIKDIMK